MSNPSDEIQIVDICDDDYGEVVDLRLDPSLPNIVLDHKQSSHNHYHTSKLQQHSKESQHCAGSENANMNFRYFPDILRLYGNILTQSKLIELSLPLVEGNFLPNY